MRCSPGGVGPPVAWAGAGGRRREHTSRRSTSIALAVADGVGLWRRRGWYPANDDASSARSTSPAGPATLSGGRLERRRRARARPSCRASNGLGRSPVLEVCQPTGWASRLVIAWVQQDPNDGRWGVVMRRGLNVAWGLLPVLLVCGLAVGGCAQPETPDAGEAAEDSTPPASPKATSTAEAEPIHMPAAAPPADQSSSLPVPAITAAPRCDTHW
jgi:hypothetical protein